MKKAEIVASINDKFKKIAKYFQKASVNFEVEDIRAFRSEIRKLKVFLHLVSMESEDGLSYRITKRMKTIYGYFGIIQNYKQQLIKTKEYVNGSSKILPVCYVQMLEKEFKYWKKLSKDYVDSGYDFTSDQHDIIAMMPDQLTRNSIKSFMNDTLYEIEQMSAHPDEETLNNVRKFLEQIYFNLPILKSFLTEQHRNLFQEKDVGEYLKLFGNFRDKCSAVALLQTFKRDALDEPEKQLIKQMEYDWLMEKKGMMEQVIATLQSMNFTGKRVNELSQ